MKTDVRCSLRRRPGSLCFSMIAGIVIGASVVGCGEANEGCRSTPDNELVPCDVEGGTGRCNEDGVCESGGLILDVSILGTPPETFKYEVFCPGIVAIERSVATFGENTWVTDEPIQLPTIKCDVEVSGEDEEPQVCFSSSTTVEISSLRTSSVSLLIDCE